MFYLIGTCHTEMRNYLDAHEAFNSAIRVEPKHAEVRTDYTLYFTALTVFLLFCLQLYFHTFIYFLFNVLILAYLFILPFSIIYLSLFILFIYILDLVNMSLAFNYLKPAILINGIIIIICYDCLCMYVYACVCVSVCE